MKDDGFMPKDAEEVKLTVELPDGTTKEVLLNKKRML